jgi:glutamyl-tRNA reductase
MVIGLNHRTAPLAMRERFWIGEGRRYDVLKKLKSGEGIEEVVVLSTALCTEFLMWASEPTLAANSLLQFLGSEHGLRLTEWEHFYRLLDEPALLHILRVTSGLDSPFLGEGQIISQVTGAWEQARTIGAAGPFLNSTLQLALNVAQRVKDETGIQTLTPSIPVTALNLIRNIFGTLNGHKMLLLGAAELSELPAQEITGSGAESLVVIDESPARALYLAEKIGGTAATLAERWKHILDADVVISSTGCPHMILTREEAERIAAERNRVALVIVDMGMPRDIDPEVRRVDGILLYDLEGLERTAKENLPAGLMAAAVEAEQIVAAEAQAFRTKLQAGQAVPTIVALRERLEEICRQELESFIEERGPFTREQDQSLHAITARVIWKVASSLARELKEVPEREEQEQMTAAVTRLFHLQSPKRALAGTRSESEHNEPHKQRAVAINY